MKRKLLTLAVAVCMLAALLPSGTAAVNAAAVQMPDEGYMNFGTVTLASHLHGELKTFQFGGSGVIPFIKNFTYYTKVSDGYEAALTDNFENNANWEGVAGHPVYSAANGHLRPNNRDDNSARLRTGPGGGAMANVEYAVTFSAAFATVGNPRFFMGVRGASENLSGITGLAHSPYLELNGTRVGTDFGSSNGRFWNGSGLSGLSGADASLLQVYSSAVAGNDGPNNNLNPPAGTLPNVYYDFKIVVTTDTATLYIREFAETSEACLNPNCSCAPCECEPCECDGLPPRPDMAEFGNVLRDRFSDNTNWDKAGGSAVWVAQSNTLLPASSAAENTARLTDYTLGEFAVIFTAEFTDFVENGFPRFYLGITDASQNVQPPLLSSPTVRLQSASTTTKFFYTDSDFSENDLDGADDALQIGAGKSYDFKIIVLDENAFLYVKESVQADYIFAGCMPLPSSIQGEERRFQFGQSDVKPIISNFALYIRGAEDIVPVCPCEDCTCEVCECDGECNCPDPVDLALAIINSPTRTRADIISVFTKYADVLQLASVSGFASANKELVAAAVISRNNLNLVTAQEVRDEIDAAIKSLPLNTGNGNAGNGGGGSASKGGGGTSVSISESALPPRQVLATEPSPVQAEVPFSDLSSVPWAVSGIENMKKHGFVSGDPDGLFYPNRDITRAEFVRILVVSMGFEANGDAEKFTDVSESDWYYKDIMTARSNGIMLGSSNGAFEPNVQITRQDMVVMLYRITQILEIDIEENANAIDFKDANEIADYASEAIEKLSGAGIIQGDGDGYFAPLNNATRAQAAIIVDRFIQLFGGGYNA